jgi:hypothetical protein
MQNFRVKGITRVEEVKVDLVKLQWAVGCKRLTAKLVNLARIVGSMWRVNGHHHFKWSLKLISCLE